MFPCLAAAKGMIGFPASDDHIKSHRYEEKSNPYIDC